MRELILKVTKIKGKKADYVVTGSISGCKVVKDKLIVPGRIYGFLCDAKNYSTLFYVEDDLTVIPLPDFKEDLNIKLIGG